MRIFYLALLVFGLSNYSYSQEDEINSNDSAAATPIKAPSLKATNNEPVIIDYNQTLKKYLDLYITNSSDLEINFTIGFCYLHTNSDKSKALPYLEFIYNKGEFKDDLLLYLGMAYMYSYKFDDALRLFNDYRGIINSKKGELVDNYYEDLESGKLDYQKKITTGNFGLVEHYIENCESAKELIEVPVNVTFENLGKEVNSKYSDYSPFITQDQRLLYFTSRREENLSELKNAEGYFTSDIYVSKVKDGQWTKAENMGAPINSVGDEHCVFVKPKGEKMIVFADNENLIGDLYIAPLLELNKNSVVDFDQPINTPFREFDACISEDENVLFVSSNRPEGRGETDIYMFNKLANGTWGLPINLGSGVNTKYKESFPNYDEKNCILYFASEGHTNIGGFDIFRSQYDFELQKFGPAENIGFPINTPEDEMDFCFSGIDREAYISSSKPGGFGDLDIYKIVFNDVENRPSIIRGVLTKSDWTTDIDASVCLIDTKTNKIVDEKNVNPKSGRYVFSVEPGSYKLTASSDNYEYFEQEINVYDKADYVFEIEKNILLQASNSPAPVLKKTP